MKTNFTPGPWKVVNAGPHWNNETTDNYQIQYGEDGECISDHVYELADAHLIAAAIRQRIEGEKDNAFNINTTRSLSPNTIEFRNGKGDILGKIVNVEGEK